MTTPVRPGSVPADGRLKVVYVPALATPAAPKLTEVNAAGALDVSCYLTQDGWSTGTEQASVTDDRLCSDQSYERPGRLSESLSLMYVYDPQDTAVGGDNQAYLKFLQDSEGYFVARYGKRFEEAFAVGDIVSVRPVQFGVQIEAPPEANSVLKISQKAFITGQVLRRVAMVA